MKNYKHVSNNKNAMKLAAVASAAVMLAPVAMNSFSTFADGAFYMNDSQGTKRTINYPVYTTFATVASAVAANQNGTNGQANSGSQEGATVGFANSDLQSVLDQISALTINPNAGEYVSQRNQLDGQYNKLEQAANTAKTALANTAFPQLNADNQLSVEQGIHNAQAVLANVQQDALAAQITYQQADADAVAAPKDATKIAVANAAAQAAKDAMGKYQSYANLVAQYNEVIGRKTNNGSVYEAAQAAGLAISHVPAGADRDAFTASLSQIQAIYAVATKKNVSAGPNVVTSIPDNAKAIDAAAAKAVADLNNLAGQAFKLAPTSATGLNGQVGTVKINYNKNYGIQIWTAEGKAVRFNKDEVAKGYTLFGKPVKVGDAKKLQGQKNFKVFAVNGQKTVQMNGTTYYNLGGDQYIDAAYTTFTAAN